MKIPPGWDIPLDIRVRLGDRSGWQRELCSDGHLVLVLHKVPTGRKLQRESVYFWRPPSGDWRSSERGQPKRELQKLVEQYETAVVALGERHDLAVSATDKFYVLEHIGPINRAICNLSDVLTRVKSTVTDPDAIEDLQNVCDLAADVARNAERLEVDARHALDFHIALQSEIQSAHSREVERTTHRLNSLATVFLPVTAVASVFGMNLKNGLEEAPPWMFWLILTGSIAAGLLVSEALLAFKFRKHQRSQSAQ